jgi:hypothetical protein
MGLHDVGGGEHPGVMPKKDASMQEDQIIFRCEICGLCVSKI